MNPITVTAIVVLALVATGSYFYGTKKNRWIVSTLSKELEETLKPLTANYVNIGGSIGYNFAYSLNDPYSSAKGTVTLSPRHSLLYLPISYLIGVKDRFFVNVFTKKKLRGEGHLVMSSYLRKARIEGIEEMQTREAFKDGTAFTLLWRGADLSAELDRVLESLPDPARLRHFCAYPETKTFFVHGIPKNGSLGGNLEAVVPRFPAFMAKEKG